MEDILAQTIKKMTADSPCDCNSGKTWKQCCGKYLDNPDVYSATVRTAPGTPVRWFLADLVKEDIHRDGEGRPLVFTDRAQAFALGQRIGSTFLVVGMSEEKWALFQNDFPTAFEVSDAVA
jgi:hypothetical protein